MRHVFVLCLPSLGLAQLGLGLLSAASPRMPEDEAVFLQTDVTMRIRGGQDGSAEVSTEDMLEMLSALQDSLLTNPGLKKQLDIGIGRLETLVSNFSQRNQELDVGLVQLSRGIERETFQHLLANYFNLTLSSQVARDEEASRIYSQIEASMPDKLRLAVQPVVSLFFSNSNTSAPFDHATFKATPEAELCGKTEPILEYMETYHVNLSRVDGLLNTTARILPILNWATPEAPKEVSQFLQSMVELGFRETSARERSYTDLRDLVSPVVSDKLGCTGDAELTEAEAEADRSSAFALYAGAASVLCQALMFLVWPP